MKANNNNSELNYGSLLRSCAKAKALSRGKLVHGHMLARRALEQHEDRSSRGSTWLQSLLVQMYADCARPCDARRVFDKIPCPDRFSWNIMISCYARNDFPESALALYRSASAPPPDRFTFLPALSAVSVLKDLKQGVQIHARIASLGRCTRNLCPSDLALNTALLNAYAKCGSFRRAESVFAALEDCDRFCWNAMIAAYTQFGYVREALNALVDMRSRGMKPDKGNLVCLAGACSTPSSSLSDAKMIHEWVSSSGEFESDLGVNTALVVMYGKVGSVDDARAVFDAMPRRDFILWSAMLSAYTRNGYIDDALTLFRAMDVDGEALMPDLGFFLDLLRACSTPESLPFGREIHRCIVTSRFKSNPALRNALLGMYGKCGSPSEARSVFDNNDDGMLYEETVFDNNDKELPLGLFQVMEPLGVKEKVTPTTNQQCILTSRIELGAPMMNTPLNMYGECGQVELNKGGQPELNNCGSIESNKCGRVESNKSGSIKSNKRDEVELDKCGEVEFDKFGVVGLNECGSIESNKRGSIELNRRGQFESNKCGRVESNSTPIFIKPCQQDVITWNTMLTAYTQNGHSKEALELYRHMGVKGVKPDKATFLCVLNACSSLECLEIGREIHQCVAEREFESELTVKNALLNMYSKCGSLKDARSTFDGMHRRDMVSWNTMLMTYTQDGHVKEALELLHQMDSEGVKLLNKGIFCRLLDTCGRQASLEYGRAIHKFIISSEPEQPDVAVMTAILNMYGKCGGIAEALSVFDGISQRDTISWNAMISVYVENGHGEKALELYQRMQLEDVKPNKVTFLCLLNACSILESLKNGRAIHECIAINGLDSDGCIKNALVSMYGKCGSLKEAESVFYRMQEWDVVSWNAMLTVYVQNGRSKDALELFHRMQALGVKMDKVTILCVTNACASLLSLDSGRAIHEYAKDYGFEADVSVKNALLNMYGKCGSLEEARSVFDKMERRDVISWNCMLTVYVQSGHAKEALDLFRRMDLARIKPDKVTFLCLLNACTDVASLEYGRMIHECIIANNFDTDLAVKNTLLNMYGKCGSLREAISIFHGMQEKNGVSWNAMLTAYGQNGLVKETLELFRRMDLEGVQPDKVSFLCLLNVCVGIMSLEEGRAIHECIKRSGFESDLAIQNALVSMYGRCGSLKEARKVFNGMCSRDLISWNAMLAAYAQNESGSDALELFQRMNSEGVKPDRVTTVCLLDACASLVSLEHVRAICECISEGGFATDLIVSNALLNLYCKCGSLAEAQLIFDGMDRRDVISWNALLGGYAQNGHAKEALVLFLHMPSERVKPDMVTFLCMINACGHAGLWDEGYWCFVSMLDDHGITSSQEHYMSLLDLLGRAGCLNEAEDMVKNMPVEIDAVGWRTLLCARRMHRKEEQVHA